MITLELTKDAVELLNDSVLTRQITVSNLIKNLKRLGDKTEEYEDELARLKTLKNYLEAQV